MKKRSTLSLKNLFIPATRFRLIIVCVFSCLLFNTGCDNNDDDDNNNNNDQTSTTYSQVNLVADANGYGAAKVDTNFTNSWGISFGPTGVFWIASAEKSVVNVYDREGNLKLAAVAVPAHGQNFGGAPTGGVTNTTTDFIMAANGQPAKFIYAGEGGTIHAWNSGDSTRTMADRSSSGAVYKGLAIANDGGSNFLYVTNFKGRKIDVFDRNFNYVTSKPFNDPNIPADFGPFNIQNINGNLYVTYAKLLGPDNEDDAKGPGNGYVDVFSPNGMLIKRFASQGTLNSPWGMAVAPSGFGKYANAILIGNFGDGRISAFDTNGTYLGQLENGNNTALIIDGLWGIVFPQNGIPAGDPNQLFFAAGPNDEANGLYGYIKPN
jgi:uncharacterized protein (TIGR03118 family)